MNKKEYTISKDETFDVVFNDETDSNDKGFNYSYAEAKAYVAAYNGTNESYFEDYKGGVVSIVSNLTGYHVCNTLIK